ncbi:DUF3126 family protein [Alphaproteobacteria bacterium]|nr:DUF3126 family protein [Alphaproteobacteria bacterium]
MNNDEILRVQAFMRLKFENEKMTLKRGAKDDMVEVYLADEFIGTLFRDEDEGEVSYDFNMAILEFDLPTI